MKLYTEVKLKYSRGELVIVSSKSHESNEPVALAKGGKTPAQTTTTSSAPWTGQQNFLSQGFGNALENYNQNKGGIPFFPGQTYAGMSGQTNNALQGLENRAMAGSPLQRAGNEQMQRVIQGDYLNNPYLSGAIKSEFEDLLPMLQSNAARTGNFHSSAAKLGQSKELAKIVDRRMADQYNQERARQDMAAGMAPGMASAEYNDLSRLLGVGGARENEEQKGIDEAMARYHHGFESPHSELAKYMSLINGNYGGESTQTQTGFKGNKGAGMLGGALGGAQLGSMFGPWGAGIGAVGGGLLGGFM